jgi:hypothetical protein
MHSRLEDRIKKLNLDIPNDMDTFLNAARDVFCNYPFGPQEILSLSFETNLGNPLNFTLREFENGKVRAELYKETHVISFNHLNHNTTETYLIFVLANPRIDIFGHCIEESIANQTLDLDFSRDTLYLNFNRPDFKREISIKMPDNTVICLDRKIGDRHYFN